MLHHLQAEEKSTDDTLRLGETAIAEAGAGHGTADGAQDGLRPFAPYATGRPFDGPPRTVE
jgi:hypothetical protein